MRGSDSAFCLDYFPTVYRRFKKRMERTETLSLLLSLVEPSVVATKLQFWELKHWNGAPSQSWRWLVVALVILGGLTALALYVAISRLSPLRTIPSASVQVDRWATSPQPTIARCGSSVRAHRAAQQAGTGSNQPFARRVANLHYSTLLSTSQKILKRLD